VALLIALTTLIPHLGAVGAAASMLLGSIVSEAILAIATMRAVKAAKVAERARLATADMPG
jgi:hypothetical protein